MNFANKSISFILNNKGIEILITWEEMLVLGKRQNVLIVNRN
jgi:hypothetical protein